ncbi:MAG: hypothetical protein WC326_01105 [Candidatus Delongbacteria bacterium]
MTTLAWTLNAPALRRARPLWLTTLGLGREALFTLGHWIHRLFVPGW